MDQFRRDVFELLRFSLTHPPASAHLFFPMFRPEQIRALYEIPAETRSRIWSNRTDPNYLALFDPGAIESDDASPERCAEPGYPAEGG